MVAIRTVPVSDLPAFRCLHNRYVDRDESLDADEAIPTTEFDVIAQRVEGDTRKLYVAPGDGGAERLDAVREAFDDSEAILITSKTLDEPE